MGWRGLEPPRPRDHTWPTGADVTVYPVRSIDRAAAGSLLAARGLPWANDGMRGIVHGPETVRTQGADLVVFLDRDGALRRTAG